MSQPPLRRYGLPATGLLLIAGLGCPPEPGPSPEPCASEEPPYVSVATRAGASLDDMGELDVFPPPQGGVFTELDLTIGNLGVSEVEFVRVDITSDLDGSPLAAVRYFGEAMPLACNEQLELFVDNLPVGFDASASLAELDGQAATMIVAVDADGESTVEQYRVTLRATDF